VARWHSTYTLRWPKSGPMAQKWLSIILLFYYLKINQASRHKCMYILPNIEVNITWFRIMWVVVRSFQWTIIWVMLSSEAPIPQMVDFNFQQVNTNSSVTQITIINKIFLRISLKSLVLVLKK